MPATENRDVQLPSAVSLLKPSWAATRINLSTFTYLILTPLTLTAAAESLVWARTSRPLHLVALGLGWTTLLAAVILWAITVPAITYVRIQSVRSQKVTYGASLRKGILLFYRWWILQLLLSLIVIGGFILLIVPGFFMIRRYVLSRYILVDQNLKPIEALRESVRMTNGYNSAMWSTTFLLTAIVAAYTVLPRGLGILAWTVLSIWNLCGTALRYDEVLNWNKNTLRSKKRPQTKNSKAKAHARTKKKS
jgi:uncharacterized membrane protein